MVEPTKTTRLCWILLCYLGSDGISIRAILVPQHRISELLGSINGWFADREQPATYEMQTSRELSWVIRGEPMAFDDKEEHAAALSALRAVALEIMMPEIEALLGTRPLGPLGPLPAIPDE